MSIAPSATTGLDTAVRLVQVRKRYPNGPDTIEALRSVSLALVPGSSTAVMGPSGSGKSTFLTIAAGLETPSSGQVFIGDTDLTTLAPEQVTRLRRSRVGFVFQSYNLIEHLSVAENIHLPLLLDGRRPDPAWQQYLLTAVGLDGMAQRRPSELSGGQRQRVAIARALIARPTVVFADEPTGALDARTGAEVLDVLRTTARRLDQTLVLVTHDAQVASMADDVLFLADGSFVSHLQAPSAGQIRRHLEELAR
ncbi:ABC transporter ATP-binding protein [Ruania zhangjianzhongii]|uniref:ABC transporter ATP-binding protein n=1 Tax=Ruania zhangjianzhongii TaxID=2603206 RepID=UPI0011CAB224|nr:ABC transporter ATP-binding protein [Ruania zhangjianzhongii]